jgi:lauroyl/myristoyl acyltransferase
MNAFIEERVLEAPAEYFWAHKRFKNRPRANRTSIARASTDAGSTDHPAAL